MAVRLLVIASKTWTVKPVVTVKEPIADDEDFKRHLECNETSVSYRN